MIWAADYINRLFSLLEHADCPYTGDDQSLILPDELIHHIFLQLDMRSFAQARLVCRRWSKISAIAWHGPIYRSIAIGCRQWKQLNVPTLRLETEEEEMKALPSDVSTLLQSPCPFWEGKRVVDTHILIRIPKGIELYPIAEALYRDVIKYPKWKFDSVYSSWKVPELNLIVQQRSYWCLVTKTVVAETIMPCQYRVSTIIEAVSSGWGITSKLKTFPKYSHHQGLADYCARCAEMIPNSTKKGCVTRLAGAFTLDDPSWGATRAISCGVLLVRQLSL